MRDEKIKKIYRKLVRNRIPNKIIAAGEQPDTRTLNESEHVYELRRKILEEANELLSADSREKIIEEIGDLVEVMMAYADAKAIPWMVVDHRREEKKMRLGGFDGRVFLVSTSPNQKITS